MFNFDIPNSQIRGDFPRDYPQEQAGPRKLPSIFTRKPASLRSSQDPMCSSLPAYTNQFGLISHENTSRNSRARVIYTQVLQGNCQFVAVAGPNVPSFDATNSQIRVDFPREHLQGQPCPRNRYPVSTGKLATCGRHRTTCVRF